MSIEIHAAAQGGDLSDWVSAGANVAAVITALLIALSGARREAKRQKARDRVLLENAAAAARNGVDVLRTIESFMRKLSPTRPVDWEWLLHVAQSAEVVLERLVGQEIPDPRLFNLVNSAHMLAAITARDAVRNRAHKERILTGDYIASSAENFSSARKMEKFIRDFQEEHGFKRADIGLRTNVGFNSKIAGSPDG